MNTTTSPDRAELLATLKPVFTDLINTVSSFSDDVYNKVPFAGSWTAGQVVDHISKSIGVSSVLNGTTEKTTRDPLQFDEGLKSVFLDFDTKMKSPDFILPDEKEFSKDEQISFLKKTTEAIINAAKNLDLTETCMDFEFPTIGHLTRIELLYFVSYHTRRHTHQLKKIRQVVTKP